MASQVDRDVGRFGSLVVGPGLGAVGRSDSVTELVATAPTPMVVDGDALGDGWAAHRPDPTAGIRVYTPHDGEYRRGTGAAPGADRIAAARSAAASVGGVVLLKGATTVIADRSGRALVVTEGDQRLATAGSGDVLSGVIGALLARGLGGSHAAAAGAFVHGWAGLRCPAVGATASTIAGEVPRAASAVAAGGRDGGAIGR